MPEDEPGVGAGRWEPQDQAAWYEARDAMIALRDVLIATGLAKDFPYLRADINAFGQGIVELGRTTPEATNRISELLRLGLTVDAPLVDNGNDPAVN